MKKSILLGLGLFVGIIAVALYAQIGVIIKNPAHAPAPARVQIFTGTRNVDEVTALNPIAVVESINPGQEVTIDVHEAPSPAHTVLVTYGEAYPAQIMHVAISPQEHEPITLTPPAGAPAMLPAAVPPVAPAVSAGVANPATFAIPVTELSREDLIRENDVWDNVENPDILSPEQRARAEAINSEIVRRASPARAGAAVPAAAVPEAPVAPAAPKLDVLTADVELLDLGELEEAQKLLESKMNSDEWNDAMDERYYAIKHQKKLLPMQHELGSFYAKYSREGLTDDERTQYLLLYKKYIDAGPSEEDKKRAETVMEGVPEGKLEFEAAEPEAIAHAVRNLTEKINAAGPGAARRLLETRLANLYEVVEQKREAGIDMDEYLDAAYEL